MTYRKKLIEVALPQDAINRESAREKSIRHGHPSTLHLWWARRPLAACRAVIFSSLVDDPDEPKAPKEYLEALDKLDKPPTGADSRRERLFYFIERLVKWESTTDEKILAQARKLIRLSCEGKPPPVLDPFCGGGSIPLEAQRLGLETYASDLNPVAVLITKALIEIPPKFAGKPPVNPDDRTKLQAGAAWKGAAGLAADVRYYGKWMRDRAWEKIGHLYPNGPNGETVIAWLWARTVKCPNPACGVQMPLVRSFWLSTKKGKETWVEPSVDGSTVVFEVRRRRPADAEAVGNGTKVGRAEFRCLFCEQVADGNDIKAEGMAGRMGQLPMAVVSEGNRGRSYSSPQPVPDLSPSEASAVEVAREGFLSGETPKRLTGGTCYGYGLTTWGSLFTPRQLVALTTFSDLVGEVRELALQQTREAGLPDDGVGIADGGSGAPAYADAVAVYLGLGVSKLADSQSSLARWKPSMDQTIGTFGRQALPMVWDFAESNAFNQAAGDYGTTIETIGKALLRLPEHAEKTEVGQLDASSTVDGAPNSAIATDPPYYDNVAYADLSDFFYIWLRRALGEVYPDLFSTVLTPKAQELVATPYRFHGDRSKAERRFEDGLGKAFALMRPQASPEYPLTLYYAFKQAEVSGASGTTSTLTSTGWQTMLKSLFDQSFEIVGTWPMRTELANRTVARQANALASSIVLVCRPRPENAPMATFRQFQSELGEALPAALSVMTGRDREGHSEPWVDPIDLRQAAIGPGMAVYSRYSRVQKADGSALSVREALQEINEAIDAYFDEVEGELDRDTRFCAQWYRESGFKDATYGRAEVLAQAMDVGVEALGSRGLLHAKGGKVRLLRPSEYRPEMAAGPSIWELCHRLVGALEEGEEAAARQYNAMPGLAEEARDLAYRLYLEAEKKGRAEDALGYNALVASWTDVRKKATELREESQGALI